MKNIKRIFLMILMTTFLSFSGCFSKSNANKTLTDKNPKNKHIQKQAQDFHDNFKLAEGCTLEEKIENHSYSGKLNCTAPEEDKIKSVNINCQLEDENVAGILLKYECAQIFMDGIKSFE